MKTTFAHNLNRFAGISFRGFFGALAGIAAVFLWAHPAFAAGLAPTLGAMVCNAEFGAGPFANVFSAVAYTAGAAFVGQGLHRLVKYYDNPQGTPLSDPLMRIGGGSALLAAPAIALTLIQTFYGYSAAGGGGGCAPGAVTSTGGVFGGGIGLDQLLTNLVGNISGPMNLLITAAAVLIGFLMVVRGLMKASKYGVDARENSMTRILANLIVGSLLIVAGQDFNTLLNTLFGAAETSGNVVTGWQFITQLNASQQFITAVQDAGYFFEMVGTIAFVRGWMIVKSAAEGSGHTTMAQGLTHIIGGVLAMNIFGFLQIMDSTFGTNFLG